MFNKYIPSKGYRARPGDFNLPPPINNTAPLGAQSFEEFIFDDEFWKGHNHPEIPKTKPNKLKYIKEWQKKNREKVNAASRKYYKKNRELIKRRKTWTV